VADSGGAEPLDSFHPSMLLYLGSESPERVILTESDADGATSSVLEERGAVLAGMQGCVRVRASLLLVMVGATLPATGSHCPGRTDRVAAALCKHQRVLARSSVAPSRVRWLVFSLAMALTREGGGRKKNP